MKITGCAVVLFVAVALPGCVPFKHTPEPRFFALRPAAERPASPASNAAGLGIVGVLPVSLPGFLERPQLVAWSAPGEVRVDEFLRWAEPLEVSVQRVLTDDLQTLCASRRVIRSPWARSTTVQCRVRAESGPLRSSAGRGGRAFRPLRRPACAERASAPQPRRRATARSPSGRPGKRGRGDERACGRPGRGVAKAIGTLPVETWDDGRACRLNRRPDKPPASRFQVVGHREAGLTCLPRDRPGGANRNPDRVRALTFFERSRLSRWRNLRLDESPLDPDYGRMRAVVGIQFGEDALDPPLDGVLGHAELIRDLLVRLPGRDEPQDGDLRGG